MADAVKAVAAVVLTVVAIRAVGAAHLAPIPNPAGVAVRAFAVNRVAVVAVFACRTHLLAVFPKEALGAVLIAARPVPASVACNAAAFCHFAGLLALAVPTPVPAVLTVESGWTRFPAILPTVSWGAGTRAVRRVALSVDALAVALAPGAPHPLAALAAPRELIAGRAVTVALDGAVPPRPAGVAQAAPGHGVAHRVDAAVTVVVALRTPDPGVTRAGARLLVAHALLTEAGVLAVGSPAVMIAGALASDFMALAIGVAIAFALAVRTEKLGRAFSFAVSAKVSMATAAFIRSDAHFVLLAGEVAFAEGCQAFVPLLPPSAAARQSR